MKRIGILGGSFDPVHVGHLFMAESAKDAFGLDQVIFVVALQSPFKSNKNATPQERLDMVRMAIAGNKAFAVSDVEIKRGGVSYTIDTLEFFQGKDPDAEFILIIGEDNVEGLSRWKYFKELKAKTRFIVIERDWFDVSSSLIRKRMKESKSIRYLTPDSVIEFITKKGLYERSKINH